MTGMLFVCLGAVVGAPARYLTDRWVQGRHDSLLPWGTLLVNVVGSFVLGALTGAGTHADVPSWLTLGLGTGFCGALTTYSTFSYETLRLFEEGARLLSLVNVALSLVLGVGAAVLGYAFGAG